MAAAINVSQSVFSDKSPINKTGALTIHGFGVRVRMQAGHLEIEDGIGQERRKIRLARVGHRLRRLVCVSEDGFVTLSAMRWLADQDAAFVMLDRNGKVLNVCGPVSPSDARLKRSQALAHQNGKALEISRELIRAKLAGHEQVVREQLKDPAASELIARLRERLANAESLDTIRYLEAQAAATYWNAWSEVPVLFPRQDAKRVPDHWLRFGTRHSPLTGQPRLAVNPPNAILNYSFALAESECRLALASCGLDPCMGFIHADTPYRDSLALDVLETIRPSIESMIAEIHTGIDAHQLERMPRVGVLAASALAAPFAGFGDVELFTALHEKAAVYASRIVRYHALPDGNKRTAYDVMREFIERNGATFSHGAGGLYEDCRDHRAPRRAGPQRGGVHRLGRRAPRQIKTITGAK